MNQPNGERCTLSETQQLNYDRGLRELQNSFSRLPDPDLRSALESLYVSLVLDNYPNTSEDRLLAVMNEVPQELREEVRLALWKLLDVSTSDILQSNPRGQRTNVGPDYPVLRQEMMDRYHRFDIPKIGPQRDNFEHYRKFVT